MEQDANEIAQLPTSAPDERAPLEGPPVLVGVGGSGGSVDAVERFLRSVEASPAWAIVLVLTNREALDEARLRESVRAGGRLAFATIENGTRPQAGTLYLSDPDLILTLEDGRFKLAHAQQELGHRGTIDSFLVSLAEDRNERAIGVVLEGTGTDGTLGIATLKERGGLTIAQREFNESAADFVARHLPAALADFMLPVEMIAERIAGQVAHLARIEASEDALRISSEVSALLGRIATILRNATGHDFHGYKQGTFMRRIQRRMKVREAESVEAYVETLRQDAGEVQNLFNDLLIGVTQFFRDRPEFHVLETQVIPALFAGKGAADQLRVWVLGCATGEEAYSLAILLREALATVEEMPKIQIFATDIDVRALAAARAGRYAKSIAAEMSSERLARWFVKEGETYCVVKELREMCIFSSHNVIKDAPFSKLDLVSCRNLLIYLDTELQSRVVPLFHFALRPGGYLFLGNSENVTRHAKLFEPIERRSRVFKRLDNNSRALAHFPITTALAFRQPEVPALAPKGETRDSSIERRAERIIERFIPAYLIVDQRFEIVHFSGPVGPYLGPTSGTATLDLLKLAHRDLRTDLRTAIRKCADADEPVDVGGIRLQVGGRDAAIDLHVAPVRDGTRKPRHFVVVFKDRTSHAPMGRNASATGLGDSERIERLEAELSAKGERLQTTVEELESTNEELTSSNEEYQSLNEELQSANEELETSKEELQSINEELNTVNGELAHRVQDLTRATSDLKNFLESTQIATIFLDNDLNIMTFTEAVKDLFHLIETDVGRPITHIKSRISVDQLYDDARHVLRTLSTVENIVEDRLAGTRYGVRVMPYRSVDNFIAGVVVTFMNITLQTRAETALRESEARFRVIFESAVDYAIMTVDLERRVTGWNPGAEKMMGWSEAEVMGRSADMFFTPEDQANNVPELEVRTANEKGRAVDDRWLVRKDGSQFWVSGAMTPLHDGEKIGYLKIFSDRTESRAAQERQRVLLGELQHRVRNTLGLVRSIARRTAENSDTVADYFANLDGRLNSFARVQGAVTRDPIKGLDITALVAEELLGYRSSDAKQIRIDGPRVMLQPKAAETFGLALHELATNASKYGALSQARGQLAVEWILSGPDRRVLEFSWVESGMDLAETETRRHGFGTELLEHTLNYELDAKTSLAFHKEGLRCTIVMTLSSRIAVPPPTLSGTDDPADATKLGGANSL